MKSPDGSTGSLHSSRLWHDRAFWGMAVAEFLGAFNDNVTKQLALLVCLTETTEDRQALATAVFAIPFLLFSGSAGFFADRFSKSWIVQACKLAEVAIQALGLVLAVVVSLTGGSVSYALLIVLFFMGAHSAFFGPPKYGVLPELISKANLPKANGVFLATTFLAIVFGAVLAGLMLEHWPGRLSHRVAAVCTTGIALAVIGWLASRLVRATPPAQSDLKYTPKHVFVDPATWGVIGRDRLLLGVLTTNGVFFLCGAMMQKGVNAFGVGQLGLTTGSASALLSCVAFGIAAGCGVAGKLCGSQAKLTVSKIGALLISLFLCLLGLTPPMSAEERRWVIQSGALLFGVGFGAGLLAVPLQVSLQIRPPPQHKGRVFAALSIFNWIGVLASAGVYHVCWEVRKAFELPPSVVFFVVAAFMAAVAVLLPPRVVEGRPNP